MTKHAFAFFLPLFLSGKQTTGRQRKKERERGSEGTTQRRGAHCISTRQSAFDSLGRGSQHCLSLSLSRSYVVVSYSTTLRAQ